VGTSAARRTRSAWGELLRYRQLLGCLVWRDIRVRYKQSVLGMAWAVLLPVAMMLIFTFVFTRAVPVVDGLAVGMPYPIFAYIGLVPWAFFASSLNQAVSSIVKNQNLVTKVYFPREVFPLASVGSAFADFCIAASVLVALIAYYHVATDWTYRPTAALFFLPVALAIQVLLTCGLAMLLAMANLFYRDVRQMFGALVQLWMFLTCVVYPIKNDGTWIGALAMCNPMTPIIQAYRDCIVAGTVPHSLAFWLAGVVSLATCAFGWWLFRRMAHKFAEFI
jgi:ABC-type polysaccharide/polyol phosphate export permease